MAKYTKESTPAKKMLLFSSITLAIISSYAIIRIYIVLHIYLQVSETALQVSVRTALSDWTECIKENQFNILPWNITCVFKNVLLRIPMYV